MKLHNYIGMGIGLLSMGLAWFWFDWMLSLVIFLALAGNNMEQKRLK